MIRVGVPEAIGAPRRALSVAGAQRLFLGACGLAFLLVMVTRPVPLAPDDTAYMTHFELGFGFSLDNPWFFLLEEPLYAAITVAIGEVFSPETALRVLICLTILPHLLVAMWLRGWRGTLYLLGYVLIAQLGFQLGYNQLRQGLALGAFILLGRYSGSWLVAACIATLIHTSMALMVAAIVLARHPFWVGSFVIVLFLGAQVLLGSLNVYDLLGRRAQVIEELERNATIWLFVTIAVLSAYVLRIVDRGVQYHGLGRSEYIALLVLLMIMYAMDVTAPVAGRILYYERWLALLLLVNCKRRNGAIFVLIYLLANVALSVNASLKVWEDSYLDRVASVLRL